MFRWLQMMLFASILTVGCSGDSEEDCGPSPCHGCEEGCSATDQCVDGQWLCDCDCPDEDTGTSAEGHDCTTDQDCADGTCVAVPQASDGARACQTDPTLWAHTCDTPGAAGECCGDEHCTDGSFGDGRCAAMEIGYCGGPQPPEENICRYDGCSSDADCGDQLACLPAGVLGSLTRDCIQANCESHDDCDDRAGGFCSLLYSSQTCPGVKLGCTYSDSECRRAQGCESGKLCVGSEDGQDASCLENQPPS